MSVSGPIWAVLTAAGSGSRLGADVPKALVRHDGKTLLEYALERLLRVDGISGIVITCPADYVDTFGKIAQQCAAKPDRTGPHANAGGAISVLAVEGGPSRQASVKAGLDTIAPNVKEEDAVVLVHDAARCLAPSSLMDHLVSTVRGGAQAVVPGMPVTDTIKQVSIDSDGVEIVVATPKRENLRIAQTPQAFQWETLWNAHELSVDRGDTESSAATDDAALVEDHGGTVTMVAGSALAFKITTPEDLGRLDMALHNGGSDER